MDPSKSVSVDVDASTTPPATAMIELKEITPNRWQALVKRLARFYRPNVTCPKVRCGMRAVGFDIALCTVDVTQCV